MSSVNLIELRSITQKRTTTNPYKTSPFLPWSVEMTKGHHPLSFLEVLLLDWTDFQGSM